MPGPLILLSRPDLVARVGPWLSLCRFPEVASAGGVVVCAVSGGPDSLALLALAVAGGHRVEAVHVDHGLRPGSAAEAEVVATAAASVGSTMRRVTVVVGPGSDLEARARAARYAALPADVWTGHTMDDLAETVLLHLLRGAGLDGLAPLVGAAGSGARHKPVRPLLGLRRRDTEAVCDALGWTPVDDAMNTDTRFRRVRVRHELLPLASDVAGRDVVPILARQAEQLALDAGFLDELAAAIDPTDAIELAVAPVVLGRRAVRRWWRMSGAGDDAGHLFGSEAVERTLAVARGDVRAAELGHGWRVERTAQLLRLRRLTSHKREVPEGGAHPGR